jgi:hypothetical protein
VPLSAPPLPPVPASPPHSQFPNELPSAAQRWAPSQRPAPRHARVSPGEQVCSSSDPQAVGIAAAPKDSSAKKNKGEPLMGFLLGKRIDAGILASAGA